ncbi:hypothetical protein KM043_011458 [Ampulex compressa]|nr:hypothetical protein KM043_011458 [Ampulex compressa]
MFKANKSRVPPRRGLIGRHGEGARIPRGCDQRSSFKSRIYFVIGKRTKDCFEKLSVLRKTLAFSLSTYKAGAHSTSRRVGTYQSDVLEIHSLLSQQYCSPGGKVREVWNRRGVKEGKRMISRGRMTRTVPFFGGIELAACLWIACAVLTLVASQQNFYTHGRYGKRPEPRVGSTFIRGSRYGRSGIVDAKNTKMEPRITKTTLMFWHNADERCR